MVKETEYDHHPVRIVKGLSVGAEYMPGQIVYLDFQTAALTSVASSNDVPWSTLDIEGLLPSGTTRPAAAVAAILDIAVNDAGSAGAAAYMMVATPGIIYAGKTQYIYCGNVNDRVGSRIVIVEITGPGDGKFAYSIVATGAVFDYVIKLIGWVLGGELTSYVTLPYEDLTCKFHVSH
uniref:Uncharacterized protein n=1 Tax=viral metagenome TaxID=1070528 RepID=A0A6M3M527_9ZZZZ